MVVEGLRLQHWFSDLDVERNHLEGLLDTHLLNPVPRTDDTLDEALGISIAYKFPSNADAIALDHILRTTSLNHMAHK